MMTTKKCMDNFPTKGSTINDLGDGGGKMEKEFIWKLFFFLEKAFWNLFFPGEGPLKFLFLDFLWPHPEIINGHPLI